MLKRFLKPKYKLNLVRLGDCKDGGYLIPKHIIKQSNLLLSFGLGDNWSFEKDFKKKNYKCDILCFDHTVNRRFWYQYTLLAFFYFLKNFKSFSKIFKYFEYKDFFDNKSVYHYEKKLVSKTKNHKKEISFQELKKNYSDKKIFVKMDIDNDEWRVLPYLKYFKNITCMVIEFHNIDLNEKLLRKILSDLDYLKVVHIHPNNMGIKTEKGDPTVIELTLLNQKYINKKNKYKSKFVKNKFDFKNDPSKKDIKILFSNK